MADFDERFGKPEDFSDHTQTQDAPSAYSQAQRIGDDMYIKKIQRESASNYSLQPGKSK